MNTPYVQPRVLLCVMSVYPPRDERANITKQHITKHWTMPANINGYSTLNNEHN